MQFLRCGLMILLLLAAGLVSAATGQDCGGCLNDKCLSCSPLASKNFADPYTLPFCVRPPAYVGTFTLDMVALERNGADSQNVLFSGATPVTNVTDLNFVTELGFRFDMILPSDCGCDFNLNYFTTGHDRAEATRSDPGLSFVFFDSVPAVPAASYMVEYIADLSSFELNLRLREWPRFSPIVGFRMFELEEHFNIFETGTTTGFFSETDNEMYGLQMGGQYLIWERNRFRLESLFKVGVYLNDIESSANALNAQLNSSFIRTAVAGELQITAVYQCGPRLALRAGYQGMWLSGVAKAPDQSDNGSLFSGLHALDPGSVSYNGGFLGLEITW